MKNSCWNTRLIISIASYNTAEITERCVRAALEAVSGIDAAVIVVDNASADESVERLNRIASTKLKIIISDRNMGFAGAHNRVAEEFRGEFFLCLNSDVELTEVAVRAMLSSLDLNDEFSILAPSVHGEDGVIQPNARLSIEVSFLGQTASVVAIYFPILRLKLPAFLVKKYDPDKAPPPQGRVGWVDGMCVLFRQDAFLESGGFDESYFFDHEIGDLLFRMTKTGNAIFFLSSQTVLHLGGSSRSHLKDVKDISRVGYYRYIRRNWVRRAPFFTLLFLLIAISRDVADFISHQRRSTTSLKTILNEVLDPTERKLLEAKGSGNRNKSALT